MVARNAAADDPQKREKRHEEAEPEFRALERRRPLEVMEVDALRELLGCPCSCHSLATLARTRTTKQLAQRIDLHYFKRPTPLKCELLGCPCSCHSLATLAASSVAQRHDGMHGAEQN